MDKKFVNVKYVPTGMIFNMLKESVDQFVKEEPENFTVIDDDYKVPVEEEVKPTIYELVVEKPAEEAKAEEKPKKTTKKATKKK